MSSVISKNSGKNPIKNSRSSSHPRIPRSPEKLLEKIGEVSKAENIKAYAVGGYVRDRQLKLDFKHDIDISVVGDAPSFAEKVARHLGINNRVQIYRTFGTAQVKAGKIELEFATSRRESYHEDSRNPEVEAAPFDEDLLRRDFTINALAVDVCDPDTVIDHFNGLQDLDDKIIRTPRDPEKTFDDDPLRILRAIRFAARLNFDIAEETWEAIKKYRKRLEIIVRERINDEFFKILSTDHVSLGLDLLYRSGVLEVIFPEIAGLAGVEQRGKHHHKDVFYHTLQVVDKVVKETEQVDLRFAALIHDIGKPKTKRFDEQNGWTFHGHEHVGQRMVKQWDKKYKLSKELVEKSSNMVRLHMRPINLQDEGVTDSAIRRLVVQAGEQIDDLLLLCRADITSGNQAKVQRYLAAFDNMVNRMDEIEAHDQMRAFQSPIRGEEIMERTGLREGPEVGLIKVLIEEAILDGEIEFTYEAANSIFDRVHKYVMEMDRSKILLMLKDISRSRSEGDQARPEGFL